MVHAVTEIGSPYNGRRDVGGPRGPSAAENPICASRWDREAGRGSGHRAGRGIPLKIDELRDGTDDREREERWGGDEGGGQGDRDRGERSDDRLTQRDQG